MTKIIAKIFILFPLAMAVPSFASDSDEGIASTAQHPVDRNNIVEVKPLISWSNFNDNVPGPFGLAFAGETTTSGKWRLVAEVSYWSLNRSDEDVIDIQKDDGDSEAVEKSRSATAALIGCRYYGKPQVNSWYAGGKIGYMTTKTSYAYKDSRINDNSSGIPLVFEGGYRWLWETGFTVRVGFNGERTALIQRSVTVSMASDSSETGKDEVKGTSPKFAPSFDVGLGYAF